ncbi:MAG: hypothetical protein DLM57_17900 [Pseudonocardiales bacterium]|nr:MAG: hypothetical protein DLM57_17900 [Pseudonocardiales bacterium]
MNTSHMIGLLGFLGALIGGYAYVPQINHLITEKCSAGISPRAFRLWTLSSALVLVNALYIRSAVFTLLGIIQLLSSIVILIFSTRNRGRLCESHLLGKEIH